MTVYIKGKLHAETRYEVLEKVECKYGALCIQPSKPGAKDLRSNLKKHTGKIRVTIKFTGSRSCT